jgi:hypothetical protein
VQRRSARPSLGPRSPLPLRLRSIPSTPPSSSASGTSACPGTTACSTCPRAPSSSTSPIPPPRPSIDADKIATGIGKRDDHLKSPDFFNSKEFPKIAFRATSFEKVDARRVKVKGDLTLLNVTKPVDVALEFIGEGDTAQGHKAGLEATFTIKRSDFGMTTYLEGNAIGDEVKLIVALEGKRQ